MFYLRVARFAVNAAPHTLISASALRYMHLKMQPPNFESQFKFLFFYFGYYHPQAVQPKFMRFVCEVGHVLWFCFVLAVMEMCCSQTLLAPLIRAL